MRMDKFGRYWPGNDPAEFCAECGQPDNCGECNHRPLLEEQVRMLGGATVDELNRCGEIISQYLFTDAAAMAADSANDAYVAGVTEAAKIVAQKFGGRA